MFESAKFGKEELDTAGKLLDDVAFLKLVFQETRSQSG